MDDFIEHGEGERVTRRPRDSKMSREKAEALEEAEAIFGTDAEMQELLDFTRGDRNIDYDQAGEGEEGEEGAVLDDDEEEDDEDDEDDDDDGFIASDDDEDEGDGEAAARRAEKREARAARKAKKAGRRNKQAASRAAQVLEKLYDKETMEAHFQTSADDVVRREDLPERLQIDLKERLREKPHPKELERTARYVFGRLFPEGLPKEGGGGGAPGAMATSGAEGEDAMGIKAYLAAIANVLRLMREGEEPRSKAKGAGGDDHEGDDQDEDGEGGGKEGGDGKKDSARLRFEAAFIAHFRKEDYAPLSMQHVALIPELEIEYAHLQSAKAALLRATQAKLGGAGDLEERFEAVKSALKSAESLTEVSDVQVLLAHEVDEAGVAAAEGEGAGGGPRGPSAPSVGTSTTRRAAARRRC